MDSFKKWIVQINALCLTLMIDLISKKKTLKVILISMSFIYDIYVVILANPFIYSIYIVFYYLVTQYIVYFC